MADASLRPSQQAVVDYTGGRMAVTAVPGAGKTHTLSYLAASLVERLTESGLAEEQEVLVVTLTNSAVNSFRSRIAYLVQAERGLLPYVGYRVRTLHSLANDIVRMRPALVGLTEEFEIVDERVASAIMREAAESWIRGIQVGDLSHYVQMEIAEDEEQLRNVMRMHGSELVEEVGREIIRLAKDNLWEPADMQMHLQEAGFDTTLARLGIDLYEAYQRSLTFRGAVDFDDLVGKAMLALRSDSEFLGRLQRRWPYILEDEAQDSSQLQNDLLRLLSGNRNWVRVGDPNQSIYTTFTTANANLLISFLQEPGVVGRPLPVSGRSAVPIIRLANYLVEWTSNSQTIPEGLRGTFFQQEIRPTERGDPQQNPDPGVIYLYWEPAKNITPEFEIEWVVRSLEKWLSDHQDSTVAVLVPENSRGFKVVEALQEAGLPYEELLRSTSATRATASRLQIIFDFLADPTNSRILGQLFKEVWWPHVAPAEPPDQIAIDRSEQVAYSLRTLRNTEDFLWPGPEGDWLADGDHTLEPDEQAMLEGFRRQARLWLEASILPVDQLTLTVSVELFSDEADLALGHKIAVILRGIAENNPDFRLPELARELRLIAENQRRFLGFDDSAGGYSPRKGVVTVATMHAAKGLEWDRVYLLAVNNYSFPAALPEDSYMAEKWFIRDSLNLAAEARAQTLHLMDKGSGVYIDGNASEQARIEYAAERLRLLYVGITRARRDVAITWNMGRFWEQGKQNGPAIALVALTDFWKRELQG